MAEAVANVARRVNAIVEEGKDYLGKNFYLFIFLQFQHMNDQSWPYVVSPVDGDKESSSPDNFLFLRRSVKLQAHFIPRWCVQGPEECLRRHPCYHFGWQWNEGYFQQVFFNLH